VLKDPTTGVVSHDLFSVDETGEELGRSYSDLYNVLNMDEQKWSEENTDFVSVEL